MTDDKIPQLFGLEIRRRRNLLKLSQESLADLSQLDRTYISSVERGHRNVSLINIVRLSVALECKSSDLLTPIDRANK